MGIFELSRDIGVFGLAMWFVQHLLTKSSNRKFETYKTELEQTTREFQLRLDSQLELYKVKLNLQNYKATKVYEQQLFIIIELNKKLRKLNSEMAILAVVLMKSIIEKNEETEDEEIKQVAKASVAYEDFFKFYQNNQLFIPLCTTDKIDAVIHEYMQDFTGYLSQKGTINEISFEQAQIMAQRILNEIKQAIGQLTLDFRKLLGVMEAVS